MATVRVRQSCVVQPQDRDGVFLQPVALRQGQEFDDDDDIVRQFRWAFVADNVEEATARPGERRNTRRA